MKPSSGEGAEQMELRMLLVGVQNGTPIPENSSAVSHKDKCILTL